MADKRAIADLEEGVTLLRAADAPLELARTLVQLGGSQRRAGERVRAREPLREALDLAHRCGALGVARQAREELHAAGGRPRRPALVGAEALTPSEGRVAQLAADGYSNRQIAEALFLTQNTVHWHLRNVFRKLGVEARADLASRLRDDHTA
jgi:DNA-binding NarL/FixJ family response regulator